MWYVLYIRFALSGLTEKYVKVDNKWDIFGYIGYLYSTCLEGIERVDYCEVSESEVLEKGTPSNTLSQSIRSLYIHEH